MYNDKIYYTDDVIKTYAEKRIALSEEDVRDLLKCLVKFVEKDSKKTQGYAYKLPSLGILHKKLGNDTLTQDQEDSMWMEYYYQPSRSRRAHPLFKETVSKLYPGMTKKQIQTYQNDSQD